MTAPLFTHPDDRDHPVPADLKDVAALLDRLGAADRAAAPAALERTVLSAALSASAEAEAAAPAEAVMAAGAQLDALAARDRAAARSSLEDRIFLATRGLVTGAARQHEPALRLVGDEAPRRAVWHVRLTRSRTLRLAAAVALVAGVAITSMMLRTAPSSSGNGTNLAGGGATNGTALLVERVDHRLDALLTAFDEHLPADSATSTSALDDLLDVGDSLWEDSL